ncbi:N [Lednice virus]|uniref:Nucleoprotein n=1 Tax=Lednice virus TaxID=2656737 RepID=A0A5P8N851_9VIRU|nr:nucleocapsid protein [Lednice virus]QFR36980.1 nucleocapsid protein [Lednice virus]QLA46943.1 N [Lednice virus] [Lednice virus]
MSDLVLAFSDSDDVSRSSYNPAEEYDSFVDTYKEHLTVDNIRIFFLKAAEAKAQMAKVNNEVVEVHFGTLVLPLVNNHRVGRAQREVADSDLTLHRVSGYLARFVLDMYKRLRKSSEREAITSRIINPISAKMGFQWNVGPEIYLSTLPGTEMFLDAFKMHPLAFILLRVKKGEIKIEMAKKAMRQRYGDKEASVWLEEDIDTVRAAIKTVEKLKPSMTGLAASMTKFLQELGITK